MTLGGTADYDRAKEVKDFDDSKIGVKGLVESGTTTIPRFFIHPPEKLTEIKHPPTNLSIPAVDLSDVDSDRRSAIIQQIYEASHTWGFFQVTNHGIPLSAIDEMISAIRSFNEQPPHVRSQYYGRGQGGGVAYNTNFDLFQSKAASWRDTLQVRIGPEPLDLGRIPEICRREVITWDEHVKGLGEVLMELLSEGLGLDKGRLKELTCLEGRAQVAHYYPYCPQPDLTLGIGSHTDPDVLTVLLQNQIGGLQVKHGDEWVEVKPLSGALVINIGDLLQIMSNDEYKSVEHRVLANPFPEPRISIATFFNPGKRMETDYYGPVPELVSHDKPTLYRNFTMLEFFKRFFTRDLGGLIDYFKL
ncbi:1-aminocyclopropane-1-carboxylate oxidase homolog 4-like [Magnolia sinica]|uniref:1-aminocyclopropane-1-carboxylate oxidase homolog 4-like n=1 Tax=Magnolia sinica TaxID=86752 RepID=UPI002658DDFA|nr:1-aminocyclopropane-1-carboxylate oxidase homolog 4-like [Magnolia sinica]